MTHDTLSVHELLGQFRGKARHRTEIVQSTAYLKCPAAKKYGIISAPAKSSMSSAKRRLVIILPPMLTVPSRSSKASVMILSRNMLKRVGESRHPCQAPTVVRNQSPMLMLKGMALVDLLQRFLMTCIKFVLMLYFFMVAHKAVCQTLSKAFLKAFDGVLGLKRSSGHL